MAVPKQRVDAAVVEAGLAPDLRAAQALILAGKIVVADHRVDKPGTQVDARAVVRLAGSPPEPYVSRGGRKLAGALADLAVDPRGLHALDLGASTGGFTDCLLQHGALSVVAVDVGWGLLANKLRSDPRVVLRERTSVKDLQPDTLPQPIDLLVADLSFIGLAPLLPVLAQLVRPGGQLLLLVKPQFEAKKAQVGEGGVVRDPAVREEVTAKVRAAAEAAGLDWRGAADCRVPGPAGNVERFVLLHRG